ncbi:MAG: HRDC domain-containing protein [Acidobacteriota bacterium]|nr:HRDC domain-containing protein [Acidobacteriota bacterium]
MKCKTFKIHLDGEAQNFEEAKLNKFLENLNVRQIFSSLVGSDFWSVLIFYDDDSSVVKMPQQNQQKFENVTSITEQNLASRPVAVKTSKPEKIPVEPIALNADEDKIYAVLRDWRNEQAARDGLPPYMIAHNDSLMLMTKTNPQTLEELVQIKGFGEKRAQKYGDEILRILSEAKTDLS